MKILFFTIISTFSLQLMGQNLNSENLKNLIGERVNDFEEFFQLTSDKTEDNFGDLTVYYDAVELDGFTVDIVLSTAGKNISKITLANSEQRTSFFKAMGTDIEKSTPEKRNYKTIYISLTQNKSKHKTYFDSVNDLIEVLKKSSTDLTKNHGLVESQTSKITLTIDSEKSIMTII